MIIGAKRILEIIGQYNIEEENNVPYLLKEIHNICERWIDIQENDGNPVDASSLDNTILKKQIHWDYSIMEGLTISCAYAPSSSREQFLSQIEDDRVEPTIPIDNVIEKSSINMDVPTALRLANEIFKNTKEEPKIVVYQSSVPRYLELINSFHNIIEDQQDTIDSLVARLTE